jgi:hypothetical protein
MLCARTFANGRAALNRRVYDQEWGIRSMSLSSRKCRTLAPRVDRLEERLALSTLVTGLATASREAHEAWASHGQSRALDRTPMRSQGVVRGDGAALAHPGGFSNSVVMARLTASDTVGRRLRQQAIHTHAPAGTGVITASAGSHPVRLAMRSSAADTAQAAPSRQAGFSRFPASKPGAIRPLALAPDASRSTLRRPMMLAPSGPTSGGGPTLAIMDFYGGTENGMSGGGGGPVDHTGWYVWISGGSAYSLPAGFMTIGQQSWNDVDVPDVPQGSKFTGLPMLSGNGATGYQLTSYTWTFPQGALKGWLMMGIG